MYIRFCVEARFRKSPTSSSRSGSTFIILFLRHAEFEAQKGAAQKSGKTIKTSTKRTRNK